MSGPHFTTYKLNLESEMWSDYILQHTNQIQKYKMCRLYFTRYKLNIEIEIWADCILQYKLNIEIEMWSDYS